MNNSETTINAKGTSPDSSQSNAPTGQSNTDTGRRQGLIGMIIAVWRFYRDGFREMTIGRTLWALILVKLFIMFAILKVFFFPDLLQRDFDNDADRAAHVRKSLTGE